jgi:ABC-type sugar transport system permease subunit
MTTRPTGGRSVLGRLRPSTDLFPYWLVLPLVLIELLLVGIPLAIGVFYSLHRVEFFQLDDFLGLRNYLSVLRSPEVLRSLSVTAVFTVFSLFFTFVVGFGLALHLERDSRYNVFLRAVVLVPHVISILVGSLLLKWILSLDAGILPLLLQPFGLADMSILGDPQRAMGALVFNGVWRDSAFGMVLLMAGLKSIPVQLYAAARVDGAGPLYRFRRITLPLMRVPILITVVRLVIHFVNVLTFALVLTGGGPGSATRTVSLQLYRLGFESYRFGQANALAFIMVLFNIVLILILVRLFRAGGPR